MKKIPDKNLHLLILQAAWSEKLLPPFDKEAFFRDVIGEEWDDQADYNYEPDQRVADALLAIPISDEVLGKVKRIEWDGGKDVFAHIWSNFDGGGDYFRVRDLSGIGACKHLRELVFIGGAGFSSIAPVAELKDLEKFQDHASLDALADISPLTKLPKLKEALVQAAHNKTNDAAIVELQKRGVLVKNEM